MPTGRLAAEAGTPPSSAQEIAEALRTDPILLSTILGNGATDDTDRDLHAKLEQAQYPVFVVMVPTPAGLDRVTADEELASLVHARLGQDGLYYVRTSQGSGHIGVFGDLDASVENDETLISLARYTALDQVREEVAEQWGTGARPAPAVEAGVLLDVAGRASIPEYGAPVLTDDEVAAYGTAQWHTIDYHYVPDPPTVSLPTMVALAVGVVVTVVVFRALGRISASRPGARGLGDEAASHHVDPVRVETEALLRELDDVLERPSTRSLKTEHLVTAQQARSLARSLLAGATPGSTSDGLDVVGASVLARIGLSTLAPGEHRYSCCFINPLHGKARHRAELSGGLTVPTCGPCRRDVKAGRPPSALMERRGAYERPYYAGDTVWATTGYGALVDDLVAAVTDSRTGTGPR